MPPPDPAQPVPSRRSVGEVARIAVEDAFADAKRIMEENGFGERVITGEFMRYAIGRLWADAGTHDILRAWALGMASDILDGFTHTVGGDPVARPAPAPDQPHLDPEVCFVARCAIDLSIAHFRVNNGTSRISVPSTVAQALGLLQETKRQVAALRAGETAAAA